MLSQKLFIFEKELFMYIYMNYEFPFLKRTNQNQEKVFLVVSRNSKEWEQQVAHKSVLVKENNSVLDTSKTTYKGTRVILKMLNITKYQRNANQEWPSLKMSTNDKCWRGYGEMGILLHCWCECEMIQQLKRTIQRFLKKLNIPTK